MCRRMKQTFSPWNHLHCKGAYSNNAAFEKGFKSCMATQDHTSTHDRVCAKPWSSQSVTSNAITPSDFLALNHSGETLQREMGWLCPEAYQGEVLTCAYPAWLLQAQHPAALLQLFIALN